MNNEPDYDNLYFERTNKMTDLTEQFDNDEITKGSYYCKSKLDGHICIAGFISNKGLFDCDYNGTLNKGYWEILAPVPSYDEWKAKDVALTYLLAEYGRLTKELQDEKEKHITRPSLRSPEDEMVIEKQVWESTLNRSMNLQAENEELKEILERHKKATAKAQIRSCDLSLIHI